MHGFKAEIRVSMPAGFPFCWGEGMSDGINDMDEEEDVGDYYDTFGCT